MVFDTFDDLLDEETSQQLEETVRRDHEFPSGFDTEPTIITETRADTIIPVREFGENPNNKQFDALNGINLADPFTLAVEAPTLADQKSFNYAVTAFYDEFDEAPSDRLSGPLVPLEFDESGIATVTIASGYSDLTAEPVPIYGLGANEINNIEVPEGTEAVAVETVENGIEQANADEGVDIIAAAPAIETETAGVSTAGINENQSQGIGFQEHETIGEE